MKAKELIKKDCHKCVFKVSIPGNTHISCNLVQGFREKMFIANFCLTTGKTPFVEKDTNKPLMLLNKTGIQSGWCNYPFEFDPIWVTCYLGKEKEIG
jgi:hypothetical protein